MFKNLICWRKRSLSTAWRRETRQKSYTAKSQGKFWQLKADANLMCLVLQTGRNGSNRIQHVHVFKKNLSARGAGWRLRRDGWHSIYCVYISKVPRIFTSSEGFIRASSTGRARVPHENLRNDNTARGKACNFLCFPRTHTVHTGLNFWMPPSWVFSLHGEHAHRGSSQSYSHVL
jgi:hypothetical protein